VEQCGLADVAGNRAASVLGCRVWKTTGGRSIPGERSRLEELGIGAWAVDPVWAAGIAFCVPMRSSGSETSISDSTDMM
jgi:hypothetical protein